ncbi:hypothetical protein Tco_0937994, partial [Tanacetum coccineum]
MTYSMLLEFVTKRFNLDPNVRLNLSFNLPAIERDITNDDDVEFFIDCATNSTTNEIPHLYIRPPKVEARIIPEPVGILQKALAQKKANVKAGGHHNILTTKEYVRKVNEDVSKDDHFMQGPWLLAVIYLHGEGLTVSDCIGDMKKNCIKGKLELVVGVVKSSPNSLGDMTVTLKDPKGTMGEDIQCAGSDTRPPMLDKTDFASWQQRIRLYCRGKENGVNILKSIDEGPFQMGTTRVIVAEGTEGSLHLGPERPRVYSDLSQEEKDRYNADIRATNIILQGLPKDIYSLINHYTDAKDIWDNVKMLLEGSELTKEDRESQLYDDFEHFRQNKGETIHDYYVRFAKLINDMRNIKMTMSKIQLNSKFVNNMLPEWGRFVTAVKLNKGLKDSNFDQLYAYLKQHEAHANENKMMLERLTQQTVDPLALMSNGRQNKGHGNNARGAGAVGYEGPQNRVGNANPGQARQVKCYNYIGGQDNAIDEDVDELHVQDLALNVDNVFQANDCDAIDSDVDEAPTA